MSHQKKPMRGHFPSAVYDINDENLCFRSNDNFLAGSDKNLAKNMLELTTLVILFRTRDIEDIDCIVDLHAFL